MNVLLMGSGPRGPRRNGPVRARYLGASTCLHLLDANEWFWVTPVATTSTQTFVDGERRRAMSSPLVSELVGDGFAAVGGILPQEAVLAAEVGVRSLSLVRRHYPV